MQLLSAARKTLCWVSGTARAHLCHAAPPKRAEPHRAAAAGSGASGDAPLERLCSLPARPGGQGRWEGGRAQLSGQPRAPVPGHRCGARGANPGTGLAGSAPAEDGAERSRGGRPFRPGGGTKPSRGNGAGPRHPFPPPTVLSPRAPLPASPRPPARRPIPSPRRGRGAGPAGARAARPHSPPGGRLRPPSSCGGGGSSGSSGSRRVPETEAREEVRSRQGETAPFPGGGGGCAPGVSPAPCRAWVSVPRKPRRVTGTRCGAGSSHGRSNAGRTRRRRPRGSAPSPLPVAASPRPRGVIPLFSAVPYREEAVTGGHPSPKGAFPWGKTTEPSATVSSGQVTFYRPYRH